jgi:hypothetical protein
MPTEPSDDTLREFVRKRDLVENHEMVFANAIGAAVFEKPKVSLWMILVPLFFLYFVFLMRKYKNDRKQFDQDFLLTRRRALNAAADAVASGQPPEIGQVVRQAGLADALCKPYTAWVETLTGHYMDLLAAEGDSYEALVRAAYHNRGNYLLTLNRLNTVESQFYDALRPTIEAPDNAAAEIIAIIEKEARRLRLASAEHTFP